MVEQITSITAAASAILGIIITIYKLILKNEEKRVATYYEELLKPFIKAYHKDKSEDLKKTLLYDYSCIYPNESNKIMKFIETFEKLLKFITLVLSFTLFIFATICLSFTLILFILYLFGSNIAFLDLFWPSIACFIISIIIFQVYKLIDKDMYTFKECKIQKLVNQKIKNYDKNGNKYIL